MHALSESVWLFYIYEDTFTRWCYSNLFLVTDRLHSALLSPNRRFSILLGPTTHPNLLFRNFVNMGTKFWYENWRTTTCYCFSVWNPRSSKTIIKHHNFIFTGIQGGRPQSHWTKWVIHLSNIWQKTTKPIYSDVSKLPPPTVARSTTDDQVVLSSSDRHPYLCW